MISSILLAAGMSTRMGKENKLLLPIGNQTLIEHQVDILLKTQVSEVIVVVGYEANQVIKVLKEKPVRLVKNLKYEQGMTTTIQAGVWCCNPKTTGYMICLSDLPMMEVKDYQQVIKVFKKEYKKRKSIIIQPRYKGRKGHPVIFSDRYRTEILQLKALKGAKRIIENNRDNVIPVNMPNDHILMDMDTRAMYVKRLEERRKP